MKDRLHGVLSISFVLISFVLANVKLYFVSPILGVGYTILIFAALLIILGVFCRKCPHLIDNTCRHVFVGWIVVKLFTRKEPGRYTQFELLATNIPLILVILLPQYWLFQDLRFFIAFWVLTIVYILEIGFFVCKGCRNVYCEFCPKKMV
ncbi:MAG TPA: hypothetical protein VHY08_15815 [Bacillota bacterium]|nr:hypothetical protein [Bacillota bacterium]